MTLARHFGRFLADLVRYGASSGRWWVPVVTVVFGVAALVALTAKTVITPALYVLF